MKLLNYTFLLITIIGYTYCEEEAAKNEEEQAEEELGQFYVLFNQQADKFVNAPIASFVLFYDSATCGMRCDQIRPALIQVSDTVENDVKLADKVVVGEFDCSSEEEVCRKYVGKNYQRFLPAIVFIPAKASGEKERINYLGFTQPNSMLNYLNKVVEFEDTTKLVRSRFAYAPRAEMFTPEMLETRLTFKRNEKCLVLFWDDARLPVFWDHMALEYFGQEEKITLLQVNCSNNHNREAEENEAVHEVCEKYAPNLDKNIARIALFVGRKHVMDYEGAWLAFDVRYFIETLNSEGFDEDGNLIDDIPSLYKERYEFNTLHEGVFDVDRKHFSRHTKDGKHMVFFHIPWNWESNELSYSFTRVALEFEKDGDVSFDRVDCLRQAAACHSFGFTKYPMIMWLQKGFHYEYPFERHTLPDIVDFVDGMKRVKPQSGTYDYTDSLFAFGLNESTFEQYVSKGDSDAFVFFYSPDCYGCQAAYPHFEAFAHEVKSEGFHAFADLDAEYGDNIVIGRMDCHAFPRQCAEQGIEEHPTFLFYRNGKMIAHFDRTKDRTANNFLAFLFDRLKDSNTQRTVSKEAEEDDDEALVNVVKKLRKDNFQSTVDDGISVVAFIKADCDLCVDIQKPLTRLAYGLDFVPQIFTGSITVATVNCDDEKQLCDEVLFEGWEIPSMVMYWQGEKVGEVSGKGPSGLIADLMNVLPLPKVEL